MALKVIVLIDDEEETCTTIKSFLESRGYIVHTAFNGHNGLNLIREKKPDLVLLDIKMPEMNGVEVLTELRKDDPDTKVIIVTGVPDGVEVEESRKLGIVDVISKPIRIQKLSQTIEENI